jgi:hypothetical protein
MSELKTNKISPATGTEVILGDDGDTFTIPTGVTATGFSDPARNFIIDGAMTQFPEGTSRVSQSNGDYGPALWRVLAISSNVRTTVTQETSNLPSDAQTGVTHEVTTGDSSVGASERWSLRYSMNGRDYAQIHNGTTVTFQFDLLSTDGGVFGVAFENSAFDRTYVKSFTSTANTWETHSVSFATDTGGTWLFDEDQVGMHIFITMQAGSSVKTGTENQWNADGKIGATSNANHVSGTSKFIRMTNVGLYKGSSAPSSFVGEPISTVKDQVAYYFRKIGGDISTQYSYTAAVLTTSVGAGFVMFDPPMRAAPTCAFFGTNTNIRMYLNATSTASTGNPTFDGISKAGVRVLLATGATMTTGQAGAIVHQTTSEYFTFDARH